MSAPAPSQRAARVLAIRSRREASGALTGGYASAFRGSGVEFDESRPYVPGDDPRHFDWAALARRGAPFVKRFREDRDQTLWLLLDVSGSLAFRGRGRPKARVLARSAGLLAAAAHHAGDRVGLLAHADALRARLPARRGAAHVHRLIQRGHALCETPRGGTRLAAPLEALLAERERPSVVVWLSDFRAPGWRRPDRGVPPGEDRARLLAVARRHDLVCGVIDDPAEEDGPPGGSANLRDPETGARRRWSGRSAARAAERHRFAAGRGRLLHDLRAAGADVLLLRTDRDPLSAWIRFFERRAGARGRR